MYSICFLVSLQVNFSGSVDRKAALTISGFPVGLGEGDMTRGAMRRRRERDDRELLKAIETQHRLHDALGSLFELLETYSPVWYEKHYRDQAESALNLPLARKR